MRAFGVWAVLGTAIGLLWSGPAAAQSAPAVSFDEAKLADAPEGYELPIRWVRFGPRGHRVAFAMQESTPAGSRTVVLVAGRKAALLVGPGYPEIPLHGFHFTPDGRHFAYLAKSDPASPRLVYQDVLRDHELQGTSAWVSAPVLSDDGRHIAWTSRTAAGDAERVMLNGQPLKPDYEDVLAFIHTGQYRTDYEAQWSLGARVRFAPGTKRAAFVGELLGPGDAAGRDQVVWGRYRSDPWLLADYLVFSPDGKRLAYTAQSVKDEGDRSVLIVDGKLLPTPFERVGASAFGPKGRQIAYKVETPEGWIVVQHGRKPTGGAWVVTGQIIFRPDGKAVAYRANRGGINVTGQLGVHGTASGGKWHVVRDGKPGAGWDWVSDPIYDAAGKHLAYAAWTGGVSPTPLDPAASASEGKWRVVVDETAGPEFDAVGGLRFSPDGRRVAYIARDKDGVFVVAGELKSEKFRTVPTRPHWNAEGTHVAFGVVVRGRELWWKVLGPR